MSELDTAPPPPLTMDSLEELRAYLWKVHQVTVDRNDPVLMLHTIHKVALDEYRRMLDAHRRTLSDSVQRITGDFADEVRLAIGDLQREALNDALRERLATIGEAAELAGKTQTHFRKNLRLIGALTLLNYLGLACTLGVLATLSL